MAVLWLLFIVWKVWIEPIYKVSKVAVGQTYYHVIANPFNKDSLFEQTVLGIKDGHAKVHVKWVYADGTYTEMESSTELKNLILYKLKK